MYAHCSEAHAIARSRTGTHASKFTGDIYCMHKIIFSLFVLWYISHKQNAPKCGRNFAWKDILFELLGLIFKTAPYTWITFRKQIFCDFSSQPTEPKKFYEPIVDGIFRLFIHSYLATVDYFISKGNIFLWCSQPSILTTAIITQ